VVTDKIVIRNIKNIKHLEVDFIYPESQIIVVTGRNGVGKTTIIKAFKLIKDPNIFGKSSGDQALNSESSVDMKIDGHPEFSFSYNKRFSALDSRDKIPLDGEILSELPIPFGDRFSRFSVIASLDSELRVKIGSSDYEKASELIDFLSQVYSSTRFEGLKQAKIKGGVYYFSLKEYDFYLREDHFSSGEYFLIQLYRLITSGARLVLIDEVDIALDAVAQVNLYNTLKPILQEYGARLIVVSHSLAFMDTVDEGGLYYLDRNNDIVSLDQKSFGYIKSNLYGFKGFDRYILTEDSVLEGFIEFLIKMYAFTPYYQHKTIGVGGFTQLQLIIEKNDTDKIFSASCDVLAVVDGDVHAELDQSYNGPTKIFCSPVEDLELYIYKNRDRILDTIPLPTYPESSKDKKASKAYWKYLTHDNEIPINNLYSLIVKNNEEKSREFALKIQKFLTIQAAS